MAGSKRTAADRKKQKSDDEQSDDSFIDKLEEQAKGVRKEEPVDIEKMTRRQRMAHFEKTGEGGGQVQSITGTQSKAAVYDMIGDENVLLSLGNKAIPTSNAKAKPK